MDVRLLEIFLAVLEHSSVAKAAGALHLSPGAVSQRLQGLAFELGVTLFVREGRSIRPTPQANHLAVKARAIVEQLRALELEYMDDPSLDTRPFHFASGATAVIHRLGKPLREVRKKFPRSDIRVTVAATEEIVTGLVERRFDLGLLSLPVSNEHLEIMPLFDEELLGLWPARSGKQRTRIVTVEPDVLARVPFLLYPVRSNMRLIIDAFFREIGLSPNVIMEADDTEAIKRLVEAGFGHSILPEHALRDKSRQYELFRIKGHRLARKQALAMARTGHRRALTAAIAKMVHAALVSQ
ncbi:MAG: LysR family transcriptional regulator [Acidobacteria bacterium]|nr:LysR family transcriptional regulator [Acidobacteriota bacterium]